MMFSPAFNKAFAHTIKIEGGYVNDPHDRGGETFAGISRRAHPAWMGWEIIDAHFAGGGSARSLEANHSFMLKVKSFYFIKYWKRIRLDEVVLESVSAELFDTAVNMGAETAARFLQEACNLIGRSDPPLLVDGYLGDLTLGAVNRISAHHGLSLLKALNGLQFMKYYTIVKSRPEQIRFFRGWLLRVFEERA